MKKLFLLLLVILAQQLNAQSYFPGTIEYMRNCTTNLVDASFSAWNHGASTVTLRYEDNDNHGTITIEPNNITDVKVAYIQFVLFSIIQRR